MLLSVNNLYRFDDFVLDPVNRAFSRAGTPVPLSAKSCQVLTYLVANPGRVVTKDELMKAVWPESFVEESNLPGYISGLRKALGDRASYIATVPGLGYKFTASVRTADETASVTQPQEFQLQQVKETTHVIIRETTSPVVVLPASQPLLRRWTFWASLAVVLVAAASIGYAIYRRSEPQQLSKVLVADFLNLTGDPAFDHTLRSSLELSLAQSPYIQLMGAAEVRATLGTMQKAPDSPLLGDLALELCRRENYQALLRGKIASGSKWGSSTMSLEVVNCTTGKTIAELHGDAYTKDAVLSTLDGLALKARRRVGESNQSVHEFDVPIMNASTFSFDALQAYNTGSLLGSDGKLVECIPYFQKAVDLDPKFAMAQSSLGVAYLGLGETQKAAPYSKAAFDLSGGVSQSEKFFIRYNYHVMAMHDLDSALTDLQEWARVYPADTIPLQAISYVEIERGNYAAGAQAAERLLQVAPTRYEAIFGNLADAYMREGRFADSKRIVTEAQVQNHDAPPLHQLLLQMAFLEHDPQAMQHEIAWTDNHPEKWINLECEAILAADLGQESKSESLFQRAFEDAIQEGQPALVDSMTLDEAAVEVDLGEMAKATKLLAKVKDHTSANWAVLATKAGSTTAADAYFKLPNEYPQGTLANKVLMPELKAVLALRRNDPQAAIALLEPARPYEMALPEVIEVRGEAYLAAKQAANAQQEFQKLIDHPAVEEPTMPKTFLAHLGLARAYALEGRMADSGKEYQTFFTLWKDADANLPVLQQAHRESAALHPGDLHTELLSTISSKPVSSTR
jgi:DNA-binding winged helix-turn-helix (wHTH) protein/tetratricopeptide (TPR) repeat protein